MICRAYARTSDIFTVIDGRFGACTVERVCWYAGSMPNKSTLTHTKRTYISIFFNAMSILNLSNRKASS